MYICKHCHMFIVLSHHNNISLMALRTYWYEELRILSGILEQFTIKSTVVRKQHTHLTCRMGGDS